MDKVKKLGVLGYLVKFLDEKLLIFIIEMSIEWGK